MRLAEGLIAAVDTDKFRWKIRCIVAFCKSQAICMDRTTGENDDVY